MVAVRETQASRRTGILGLWVPSWRWDSVPHGSTVGTWYPVCSWALHTPSAAACWPLREHSQSNRPRDWFSNWLPRKTEVPQLVAFADFWGVSTATMANFKLSVWCHWTWGWEDLSQLTHQKLYEPGRFLRGPCSRIHHFTQESVIDFQVVSGFQVAQEGWPGGGRRFHPLVLMVSPQTPWLLPTIGIVRAKGEGWPLLTTTHALDLAVLTFPWYAFKRMWNLKNDTSELIYRTEKTHRLWKQTYDYQRGKGGEGIHWEFGMNTHTTLYKIDNQQGPDV